MLTARGWSVLAGSFLLWGASRLVGSADLHVLAVGLVGLVALAATFVRVGGPRLQVSRRLSTRRAFPGTRVRVDLELESAGPTVTPFVVLEDRLPAAFGGSARAVVAAVHPRRRRSVTYQVTARSRGRYELGPATAAVADPFDLVRRRVTLPDRHELVVYPEVEDLPGDGVAAPAGSSGESSSRHLFRTGEEFYTMRPYETGDDLRRIHWPSTARTGELMIRQDETARRATAVVLLDTRAEAVGARPQMFERAVSAAASVGTLYLRLGYSLRLATPDLSPSAVAHEHFLETLALVEPSDREVLTPTLRRVRPLAARIPSLIVVTHVPVAAELAVLIRSGALFASRTAVLVTDADPARLAPAEREAFDRRLAAARTSFRRGGWEVVLVRPGQRLREVWRSSPRRRIAASS
ncbi:MAG TPA: DUF58 domain-containing protein [Actinomycetota bacterium]|nr:DUF58 domain-containing protein [Actinomycetota bacterium]